MNKAELEEFIKDFIRDNLVIEVTCLDKYGPGNEVEVGLRIVGEDDSFTQEYIYIPERDNGD